ncbi:hypothetical protein BASA81_002109 [Batrachochytrium salamandrivorans]|nr:hypothetical protein BASA81_002109 [Batrachochytrium salamandrivorans]
MFNWSNLKYRPVGVNPLHFVQRIPTTAPPKLASLLVASSRNPRSRPSMFTRPPKSDRLVILLGAAVVASFSIYYYQHTNQVFYTNRTRLMGMSWEAEKELFASSSMDSTDSEDGPLVEDEFSQEVERIARTIISACERDFIEVRGKLPWKIETRLNPVANAFNTPGGLLTIQTGLIDLCCEAELRGELVDCKNGLACIIAHELAHGYCRHGVEKLSWLPIQTLYLFFSRESPLLARGFQFLVQLPHSRLCETEADAVGLDLMARAGFDPKEGLKMWTLLDTSSRALEFLSTHPSGGTRKKDWELGLDKALEVYDKNKPIATASHSNASLAGRLWSRIQGNPPSLAERWKKKQQYGLKPTVPTRDVTEEPPAWVARMRGSAQRPDRTPGSQRPILRKEGDESIA